MFFCFIDCRNYGFIDMSDNCIFFSIIDDMFNIGLYGNLCNNFYFYFVLCYISKFRCMDNFWCYGSLYCFKYVMFSKVNCCCMVEI